MTIEEELNRLTTILSKVKHYMIQSTEDNLAISSSHGITQYYAVGQDGKRRYVSKKDTNTLKVLAKKAYNEQLLKKIPPELKRLEHFIKHYNPNVVVEVFEQMPNELQEIITPYEMSDESFAKQWALKEYETKGVREGSICYTTENGEKVRSKSELTIANKLYMKGIPYRYEQPLYLRGYGTIYPDFTILNKTTREEIYWEHFGLMSNPEYVENGLRKLNTYSNNGIFPGHGLIVTFESETYPLATDVLDQIIGTL